jgi:hypothetical protein
MHFKSRVVASLTTKTPIFKYEEKAHGVPATVAPVLCIQYPQKHRQVASSPCGGDLMRKESHFQ